MSGIEDLGPVTVAPMTPREVLDFLERCHGADNFERIDRGIREMLPGEPWSDDAEKVLTVWLDRIAGSNELLGAIGATFPIRGVQRPVQRVTITSGIVGLYAGITYLGSITR